MAILPLPSLHENSGPAYSACWSGGTPLVGASEAAGGAYMLAGGHHAVVKLAHTDFDDHGFVAAERTVIMIQY